MIGSPLLGGSFQVTITLVSSVAVVVGAEGVAGAIAARIEWAVESEPEPTEFLAVTLNW